MAYRIRSGYAVTKTLNQTLHGAWSSPKMSKVYLAVNSSTGRFECSRRASFEMANPELGSFIPSYLLQ